MTVVTTADTSQLYALAARHGLKLHGPLTVNELGLDYRIVIATVDEAEVNLLFIYDKSERGNISEEEIEALLVANGLK